MNTAVPSALAVSEQPSVDDWRALGDLIELATERLTAPVEGTHHAIAHRWLGLAKGDGSPGHSTHQTFTRRIYGSIRLAGVITKTALGTGATAIGRHRSVRPLWDSPMGAGIQAAANALWGDEFERRTSPMHTELAIRDSEGVFVATDPNSLWHAFPSPTHRLAVFLHGLGKTERCWNNKVEEPEDIIGLPDTLAADSFTPVLIRYNTGRSVPDNGTALALLMEELTANWPVAVDEIALIGHSMGGLVARSSLHAGKSHDHAWVPRVRHMVGLATPHFGSPIEKGAHIASQLLDKTALTRPLGEFIDGRSAGIKDMRHGTIHTIDHRDQTMDPARSHTVVMPPVDGMLQHHAASVVTGDASHPLGILVGDLVVRAGSATGVASNCRVEAANVRVFGGLNHLAMLHDPAVLAQIGDWLAPSHTTATRAQT